jgi:hypothetical protein
MYFEKWLIFLLSLVQNKIVCTDRSQDQLNKISVNSLVRINEELEKDFEDEEQKCYYVPSTWNDVSHDYYMPEKAPSNQPHAGQKSLVITFDTTGSMSGHLEQLKTAAKEIITHATSQAINPFYNYIFVPFDDPGKSVSSVRKSMFLNK